jgi:hypothetical protein
MADLLLGSEPCGPARNQVSDHEVHQAVDDDGCAVGQFVRIQTLAGIPATLASTTTEKTVGPRSVESFCIRATLSDQTPEAARVVTPTSIGVDCRSVLVT